MFDLNTPWPGTVVVIVVSTLALAILSILAAMFVDPDLPRSVREGAVTIWACASCIVGFFTIAIRHAN